MITIINDTGMMAEGFQIRGKRKTFILAVTPITFGDHGNALIQHPVYECANRKAETIGFGYQKDGN